MFLWFVTLEETVNLEPSLDKQAVIKCTPISSSIFAQLKPDTLKTTLTPQATATNPPHTDSPLTWAHPHRQLVPIPPSPTHTHIPVAPVVVLLQRGMLPVTPTPPHPMYTQQASVSSSTTPLPPTIGTKSSSSSREISFYHLNDTAPISIIPPPYNDTVVSLPMTILCWSYKNLKICKYQGIIMWHSTQTLRYCYAAGGGLYSEVVLDRKWFYGKSEVVLSETTLNMHVADVSVSTKWSGLGHHCLPMAWCFSGLAL